mgnify:FL=1
MVPGIWNQRPTRASTAGAASKVDRLVQDLTVNVLPGEIAVGFEDTRDDVFSSKSLQSVLDYNSKRMPSTEGTFQSYSDWDYDDVTFKLTSGVTIDEAFLKLLDIYETATGEDKDAAGYAITLAEPRLAKKIGVQVSAEFTRKNLAKAR